MQNVHTQIHIIFLLYTYISQNKYLGFCVNLCKMSFPFPPIGKNLVDNSRETKRDSTKQRSLRVGTSEGYRYIMAHRGCRVLCKNHLFSLHALLSHARVSPLS